MSPSLPVARQGVALDACGDLARELRGGGGGNINWDNGSCGGSRDRGLRNFVTFG